MYFRAHPEHIPAFLTHQRIRETPVTGGSICSAQRLTLDDGVSVFAKSRPNAPAGFFAAEAAGLRWIAEAEAISVPEVIADLPTMLVLEWIDSAEPTPAVAQRFGRELAAMHRCGSAALGAPWTGFIGSLPQNNALSTRPWPEWFATERLEPYLRLSVDNGALSAKDAMVVTQVISTIADLAGAAGAEPPSRIHGDLWPGNLIWSSDRVWLVDPAAHGGHRETDLALLALFGGVPFLDQIIAAYDETFQLTDGWRERVPLHQLYLLLVHTALFGGAYRDDVLTAARALG